MTEIGDGDYVTGDGRVVEFGPYELNNIYCGECSEMMSYLPDGCVDLTVTSPPYDNLRDYNGYVFDFFAVARQLIRVTKLGGVIVWVVADATINGSETGTSFKQALYFIAKGMRLHDTMIYHTNPPPRNHKRYEQEFEYMFVFSSGAPRTFHPLKERKRWEDTRKHKTYHRRGGGFESGFVKLTTDRVRGNVWKINSGGGQTTNDRFAHNHPAIFPEALARDHILSWSNPGDLVLDPFIGSGTTAKMAFQNGRNYLGFDISQEYVDLAKKRMSWANPPLLVVG